MNRVFGIAVLAGLAACGAENLPPVETDVLVVGGTAKGVAAAGRTLEAVRNGTAATDWKVAPAEGPKPLNSPNPGFSVISFSVKADESGRACAAVVFSRQ